MLLKYLSFRISLADQSHWEYSYTKEYMNFEYLKPSIFTYLHKVFYVVKSKSKFHLALVDDIL